LWRLLRSPWGKAFTALRDNPIRAESLGIHVRAYTLLAFVIVITGGLGSMPGALLGGVLIGLTEAMAGLFVTPSAKSMFAYAILVLVLLFRPQGIMGKKPA